MVFTVCYRGRFDQLAHIRRLADNVWDNKDQKDEEDMETAAPATRRPGRNYRNQVSITWRPLPQQPGDQAGTIGTRSV